MELINESPFEVAWIVGKISPPESSMTCIVKGTFKLVHQGTASLAEKQLELTGDNYVDENPNGLLRYPDDFAYLKPKADVLLVGACYSQDGPVQQSTVT